MKEINNGIEENYCSYKIAKLLKGKGAILHTRYDWDNKCLLWYWLHTGELHTYEWFNSFDNMLPAPTHSLAIKWLRENFDIDIAVLRSFSMDNSYHFSVLKGTDFDNAYQQEVASNRSYNEATEDALLYTLKNLIK